MIEQVSATGLEEANDMNIPIDIWLSRIASDEGEEDQELIKQGFIWRLRAASYQPRKDRIWTEAYEYIASDRAELSALVEKHILPLYKIALSKVEAMTKPSEDDLDLYYWDKPKLG
jgi:hypothetical protein